ncbi:SDR family oxidoreductase [Streptomyces sp. NPDC002156]
MSVVIVTGSSRGIGRAIAERLGADGDSVIVNYRSDREAAAKVVSTIEASGGRAVAVRADVSDPAQMRALFDAAEETYGGLDILVGNVGTVHFSPLAEATDEDFDRVFATNTRATFTALREAAGRLRDNGRIVVISSQAAVTPSADSGVYSASKAAGDQLVRAAAQELGSRGITVNSVLPGATRTESFDSAGVPADVIAGMVALTPLGRLGEPGDIADVVAFLVSDSGRWITGQTLHAGGGRF